MNEKTTSSPFPKPIFLEPRKRLEVKFYTSSIQKFLQAQLVFEKFGLPLKYLPLKVEPYEYYEAGQEELLARSVKEIREASGRNFLFFVEDTSLRIEALSRGSEDYPGLAVKEWFKSTSFEELDCRLPKDPKGRLAIVKSGIALNIPGLDSPVLFHGETRGTVANSPPMFEENLSFPWLTPKSFNGWFIPDGASQRLGEMSFETSWIFDFRIRSLTKMLERLEEYAAILNVPQSCFIVFPSVNTSVSPLPLFRDGRDAYLVIGKTCSGKTTLGRLGKENNNGPIIEASDILQSFRSTATNNLSNQSFAQRLFSEKGYDVIARRIVQMYRLNEASDFIIVGFRTIEEVEYIRKIAPSVKIVLVQASDRTRYSRFLKRLRDPIQDFEAFLRRSREEEMFGLLPIAHEIADIKIENEGTNKDYRIQALSIFSSSSNMDYPGLSLGPPPINLRTHRLFRCLSILAESGNVMTCKEIENASAKSPDRKKISDNNVNKVLKNFPGLAKRFETEPELVRYTITDAGRAYLRVMKTVFLETETSSFQD
jgi:inosine/xanthosine triphosphate pyrophosphatase family protein/dephospho-CoA kinase